ncbi:MAG: carboxypeptidase regulatory-like domain-containing protein, partial [Acidimicrobiales bacterium]
VQVESLEDLEEAVTVALDVVVPRRDQLNMRIEPSSVTGGRSTTFGILIENRGNDTVTAALSGTDDEAVVKVAFNPNDVTLEPGESEIVRAETRGGRRWFGVPTPRIMTFSVAGVEPVREGIATFIQKPRIGRWVLSLAGLICAISVFAIVITHSFEQVAENQKQGQDLIEAALDDDPTNANAVATNPGSVTGTVTGPADAPLAGVTIELVGLDDIDGVIAATSSAADGTYQIPGLSNGTFKIRAAGAGFSTSWFGGESFAEASEVGVTLGEVSEDVDFSLEGRPGSITGQVVAEDPAGSFAVLVLTAESIDGMTDAEVERAEVAPDGTFTFPEVPSPATYEIQIAKAGFTAEPRPVRLAGGEAAQGIEILLREGNGTISGGVLGPAGALGNVTVEATDGVSTIATVSLTTGDLGAFTLRDLPTPGTYTVTFSREGFAKESISVPLNDVATVDNISVRLVPALGTIEGVVRTSSGAPLGGASVTVSGGGITRTTAAASTGLAGAYILDELPIPGTYTVTFSAPGYVSETRAVDLASVAGTSPAVSIDTNLVLSAGAVGGTVTAAGLEVAQASVSLTNGILTYTTTSADEPVGIYRLAGIPAGVYTLTVVRTGSATSSQLISLNPGDDLPVDVALEPQASISGLIFDDNSGSPIARPDAIVELYLVETFPGAAPLQTIVTGADGAYTFLGLDAPNSYVVAVAVAANDPTLVASTLVALLPGQQVTGADVTVP